MSVVNNGLTQKGVEKIAVAAPQQRGELEELHNKYIFASFELSLLTVKHTLVVLEKGGG